MITLSAATCSGAYPLHPLHLSEQSPEICSGPTPCAYDIAVTRAAVLGIAHNVQSILAQQAHRDDKQILLVSFCRHLVGVCLTNQPTGRETGRRTNRKLPAYRTFATDICVKLQLGTRYSAHYPTVIAYNIVSGLVRHQQSLDVAAAITVMWDRSLSS